jgi:LCP family protein required for cell wall assembly
LSDVRRVEERDNVSDEGLFPVRSQAGSRRAPRARHVAGRRPVRRILTALGVVVALLAVTGTASALVAYYKLNGNITQERVDDLIGSNRPTKVVNPDVEHEPQNILLIGSDRRKLKFQNELNAGQRSDTTILLHIAGDRQSAVAVSIPRDTIVDTPECHRKDGTTVPAQTGVMFNTAYSNAGAACTIATVEKITKVRIDHHIVVSFTGFKDMVDALGGVKVCLPQSVNDPDSHLVLSAGVHNVKGRTALAFVRARHGLGDGSDLSRIDRQQAFLGSMVDKVRSNGLLLRPDRLLRFLGAATNSLTTDPGLGNLNALRKLAQEVKGIDTKDVTFLTAPNEPYVHDPNRVQLKSSAKLVWEALRFDRPLPGTGTKPSATPSPTASGPPLRTPPEKVSVQVLNGSPTSGEATRLAEELTAKGFNVVGVGNAPRRDYLHTRVLHDPAYNESGRTLGAAVTGARVRSDATLGSTLVVIVGSDSPQVTGVTVAGSTSSPEPTDKLVTRNAAANICA